MGYYPSSHLVYGFKYQKKFRDFNSSIETSEEYDEKNEKFDEDFEAFLKKRKLEFVTCGNYYDNEDDEDGMLGVIGFNKNLTPNAYIYPFKIDVIQNWQNEVKTIFTYELLEEIIEFLQIKEPELDMHVVSEYS